MLKALTFVAILQLGLIIYLVTSLAGLQSTVEELSNFASESEQAEPTVVQLAPAESHLAQQAPDENQLRKIVREELAAQLSLLAVPNRAEGEVPDPVLRDLKRQERDLVEQEIAHYISMGQISDVEMQMLQADIARLDKSGREEMLRRLVRAINTGELDGRF